VYIIFVYTSVSYQFILWQSVTENRINRHGALLTGSTAGASTNCINRLATGRDSYILTSPSITTQLHFRFTLYPWLPRVNRHGIDS
jgi:hypothetical protein